MEISLAEVFRQQAALSLPAVDSFWFMSPHRSVVTSGCVTRIATPAIDGADPRGRFHRHIRQAFAFAKRQGVADPLVVGAIPFDTRQPSALFIPEIQRKLTRPADGRPVGQETRPSLYETMRREIPQKPAFISMVRRAVALTSTPEVDKIVLARLLEVTLNEPIDRGALWHKLVTQNPDSFNFHVPLPDGSALSGASPELLLRMDGVRFNSLPLAGSARRQSDREKDKEAGRQLLNSSKDRHEHRLVVESVKATLRARSAWLDIPDIPQLVTTPALWHLATPIRGVVKRPDESALSLACLLHPTPALSGFPHQTAKRYIAELEPFERGLFGGIVGWCDAQGNGEWAVTIRCAHLKENQVRLFAGAGIVPASSPESEWEETGVKLSTMLTVLGLN